MLFLWMDPGTSGVRPLVAQGMMLLSVFVMGAVGVRVMKTGRQPSALLVVAFLVLFVVSGVI